MIAVTTIYEFDEFRVDGTQRRLMRNGQVVPLHSKAFDLLLVLVRNAGKDLTKDELLDSVWPGQILEESNLAVNISAVRRALGEKAAQSRFIVTIPGHGYRFVAHVREAQDQLVGVLIEQETFARVSVEHTPDLLPEPVDKVAIKPIAPAAIGWFSRSLTFAGLAVLLLTGAGFAWWRLVRANNSGGRYRQISYRQLTNNGIVFNATLSPDGKFFAFVKVQKEKESLRAGQIDNSEQIELRPLAEVSYEGLKFSHDGASLYYAFAEKNSIKFDLYKIPALGGVPVKLRSQIGHSFSISRDEKRVAFVREDAEKGTSSVVISDLNGANEATMVTVPMTRALGRRSVSWSPDGATLTFAANDGLSDARQFVYVVNLDTREVRAMPGVSWRMIDSIAWLPDGSGLAVVAQASGKQDTNQLWHVTYPAGEVTSITKDLATYNVGLSVSDDAHKFLLVRLQQLNHIWVMPSGDVTQTRQITFGTIGSSDGLLGLDWTPDHRLVYGSSTGRGQSIWTIDADGANARQITAPEYADAMPNLTSDGRLMIFESNRNGGTDIWRANLDGSDATQLTTCGQNFQPNVSPDGKWVVYKSNCDGVGSLWRIPVAGGAAQRLTEKAFSWPSVSPDGNWIACGFSTPVRYQLAILSIDGGQPARIFDSAPLANIRLGIRWTPDSKSVIYRDQRVGLWQQTIDGGAPQQVPGLPPEKIYGFSWSRDHKYFAYTLGTEIRDVILVSSAK